MKIFEVKLTYFVRNNGFWVKCEVTFHLQAESVQDALVKAVFKLEGVPLEQIEDVQIEKEL